MAGHDHDSLHAAGVAAAASHLERLGYTIVARQHPTRFGIIDLVTLSDEALAFCMVQPDQAGLPRQDEDDDTEEEAQRRVRMRAAAWLAQTDGRPHAVEIRFDSIHVIFDNRGRLLDIGHDPGAF